MERVDMILSGLGGQGILFMTKVLAHAAISKGINVIGAETHGMAQRGGSVISHLRIGDVRGSLIKAGSAHYLISLDEIEGYRCLGFLARGARMYLNSDSRGFPTKKVKGFLEVKGVLHRSMPAGKVAMQMGAPLATNLALLGFFAADEGRPFNAAELLQAVERISPVRLRKTNIDVFTAGSRLAAPKYQ